MSKIVSNSISLMTKTQEIEDPQMELLLLRCCPCSPKIAFWTRTCNPVTIASELGTFDIGMDRCLQHIVGSPVSGLVRNLAHLPLSFGGLGIPIVYLITDFSFVSSVGSSWNLQPNLQPRSGYLEASLRISDLGASVATLPLKNLSVCPSFNQSKDFSQKSLMVQSRLKEQTNVTTNVIISGRSCKGSNYWLATPPCAASDSIIESRSFQPV